MKIAKSYDLSHTGDGLILQFQSANLGWVLYDAANDHTYECHNLGARASSIKLVIPMGMPIYQQYLWMKNWLKSLVTRAQVISK